MATMREVDTAMWLHNKLSTSDDMWSGTNIWSMLTTDVLRNIQDCFHTLDSQVKIKLLMSFLYIPKRSAQEMSSELNEILEIGSGDSDDWVRILSEILRNYPETGSLNVDLENVSPVFAAIVQDVKHTMGNSKNGRNLLPMECPYLNRGALLATIGVQPAPAKHFTLRRKPKSAALKAELFQKASESSSGLKRSHSLLAGSTNTGNLKRSDSTGKSPLKQTPSLARVHSKTAPGAGTSALRGLSAASLKQQNRTAKLLDINEQPIGGAGTRETKRRKKMTAEIEQLFEEDKKKKELAKAQETSTPEYAIGLSTAAEIAQPAATTAQTSTATPSYASMAGLTTSPHLPSTTKSDPISQDNTLSASSANFSQELQMHIERERENIKLRRLTAAAGQQHNTAHPSTSFKSVSLQPPSQQPNPPARRPTLQNQPAINPSKRELKLTREQMLAAQEMFRDANKVTKPEKALILGFMAGARENPLPQQGPVITVKLSEHTENTPSSINTQQTQLVEMLFEMNYDTGHWRRLKRTRVLARQQPVEQGS